MEEEKKLYPFKFIPIQEDPAEDVLLADLGYQDSLVKDGWLAANGISEVMDTYMDRVVGQHVFDYYGRQFPVLLKVHNGTEQTPLMVCPDDEIAAQRLDFLGKSKLWYVNSAEPDSKLFLGFKRDVSAEEFYMACRHNTVLELLNEVTPKEGDHFFIYPGLVHAAGKGVRITEIAESSPLDFRLCNWGRDFQGDEFDAELNLEAAFDFIDYGKYTDRGCNCGHDHHHDLTHKLTDCAEFSVTKVKLTDPLHIYSEKFGSFVLYLCLEGEASLQVLTEEIGPVNYTLKKGECILVPAEITDFFLLPVFKGTTLLETIVEDRGLDDSYIDADADDHVHGCEDDDCDCGDDCGCGHDCGSEDDICSCGHHHHHSS